MHHCYLNQREPFHMQTWLVVVADMHHGHIAALQSCLRHFRSELMIFRLFWSVPCQPDLHMILHAHDAVECLCTMGRF